MKVSQIALIVLELSGEYFCNRKRFLNWTMNLSGVSHSSQKSYWYVANNLQKKGWVVKNNDGLTLLKKGREELRKQFPLLEWRKRPWDGKWRVVMYDLPEKIKSKRDILRNWLKRLGFGQWQMSVWISPHPLINSIHQIITQAGLEPFCSVHESKRVIGIPDTDFASKVWKLDQLNDKYRQILRQPTKYLDHKRNLELLMDDPMLPQELLPQNWQWDNLMKKTL